MSYPHCRQPDAQGNPCYCPLHVPRPNRTLDQPDTCRDCGHFASLHPPHPVRQNDEAVDSHRTSTTQAVSISVPSVSASDSQVSTTTSSASGSGTVSNDVPDVPNVLALVEKLKSRINAEGDAVPGAPAARSVSSSSSSKSALAIARSETNAGFRSTSRSKQTRSKASHGSKGNITRPGVASVKKGKRKRSRSPSSSADAGHAETKGKGKGKASNSKEACVRRFAILPYGVKPGTTRLNVTAAPTDGSLLELERCQLAVRGRDGITFSTDMQKGDLNMLLWKLFQRPMTWIKNHWVPDEGDPYGDYPWFLLNKTRNTLSVAESPGYLADGQSLKDQAKAYGHDNTLSNMTVLFVSRIDIPKSVYSTWSAIPNALLSSSDAGNDQSDSSSDSDDGSSWPNRRRSLRLQSQSQRSKFQKPVRKRARIDSDSNQEEETEVEEVEEVQMSSKAKGKQKASAEKSSDSEDGGGPSTLKLTRTLESIDLSRDSEETVDVNTVTGGDTLVAMSDDDDDRAIEMGLLDFVPSSPPPALQESLPSSIAMPSAAHAATSSSDSGRPSTAPVMQTVPDVLSQDPGARARRRASRPSIPRPKKSLW